MRFSHSHKLLLISNWKCGCTTLADMFVAVTEFDWHTRDRCEDIFGKEYNEMAHLPAALLRYEFERIGLPFDDYVKISSVRNPWARTVSLYEARRQRGEQRSFDKFVKLELPKYCRGQFDRWDSYEMFHENGIRVIDHVIRIEHLEEELRPIVDARWPGLELDYRTRANARDHKPYKDYYKRRRTIDAVADFFRYDIEQFGYQFDDLSAK